MSYPMLAAFGLSVLTFCIHTFLGGADYHAVVLNVIETPLLSALTSVLWHAATFGIVMFAATALWMAWHPNRALALTMAALQLGWAGLFIYYDLTRLGSLWAMPQWTIFLILPALILWGDQKRA